MEIPQYNQCSSNNQIDQKYYENITSRNNENIVNSFTKEYKPRTMPNVRVGNSNVKSEFQDQYKERMIQEHSAHDNNYLNDQISNYSQDEAIEQFEREEMYHKQQFENLQKKRREQFLNELNSFNKTISDPYKLLNVSNNCNLVELKKAYRQAAIKYHPDKTGGKTKDKFQN